MGHSDLLRQGPETVLLILQHFSASYLLRDINEWLFFYEAALLEAQLAWGKDDIEKGIKWSEVTDFILSYLISNSNEKAHLIYKRINFRIQLIRNLHGDSDSVFADTSIILEWLRQQFAGYRREAVDEMLKQWKENPHELSAEELWYLRKLRFWVVSLARLREIRESDIDSKLLHWLTLINLLP